MATEIYHIDRTKRQLAGLVDGGHFVLKCSNCDKPLVDIWKTRPKETLDGSPVKTRLQAECCYCGDHSKAEVVIGGFHPGGYGQGEELDLVYIVDINTQSLKDDPDGCFQKVEKRFEVLR
jgi:hypothetical protein